MVYVIVDQHLGLKPWHKFVKTVFQDVGKFENIDKHESKMCHKHALEKAKDFWYF